MSATIAATRLSRRTRKPGFLQRLQPVMLSCAATLLALPAVAADTDFTIPEIPLQSGTPAPAPNMMFILDDSGSMAWDFMPGAFAGDDDEIDDETDYDPDDNDQGMSVGLETAAVNRLYYDPEIDYAPWIMADDSLHAGGTALDAVFNHHSLPNGDAGIGDPSDDLSNDVHTFYVPRPGESADDARNFYRYQIRRIDDDGFIGPRVVRSEYSAGGSQEFTLLELDNVDIAQGNDEQYAVTVPVNTTELKVRTRNGQGDADLYVWQPDTAGTLLCQSTSGNNSEDCTIANPAAGQYTIRVFAFDQVKNVDIDASYVETTGVGIGVANAGCPGTADEDGDWRNCTIVTPDIGAAGSTADDRSEANEIVNFATWYSYHRTRMKTAKAGASEAFNQLGANFRVGYDSIWNRNPMPIPLSDTNDGLFTLTGNNNKTEWFTHLQAASANNGTPLHRALQRTGDYYASAAPWDSGTGADISCRQSFAILTTDGYWNSRDTSGYSYIGDIDTKAGPTIPRPAGDSGAPYTYLPANPYQDPDGIARDDTLADVAMHYWNRDLRPTLENDVEASASDPAFWQHMVTFGVSIGLQGSLNPKADLPAITDGSKEWPNPNNAEDEDRIDDLWHASVNGRGKFVAATNPQEFVDGLIDALSTVSERLGSASNVTANSTSFSTDTRVYQASYVSGRWSGDLKAFVATTAGVSALPAWEAAQEIPATRNILTHDGTENAAGSDGATFPTAAQITALDQSTRTNAPASGIENANYIEGDQTQEASNGGNLRNRITTVLGDIVNSSPIYVQDSETLFVGANDGMLHAFDANTGAELFAYVPNGIDLTDLATLSDPRYGATVTHKYFVDGPVSVSAQSQTPGKNYLVGTLGRGGKGVFGLDVTDPENFGTADVLWESGNDSDMGMVLGEPLVVKLNDSDTMAAIVSNGINSTDGSATLFVFDLATGAVIKEIEAGTAGANGLSAPRGADIDGDGTVDYIYAGDLMGNLWKFDLSDPDKANWGVAHSGSPMMVARDDNGVRQPITAGLALARHPDTGDIWVFVGTGRFLTTPDLSSKDIQTVYGIIDDNTIVAARTSATDPGDLVEREIVVVGVSSDNKLIRAFEPPEQTLASGKKGWFIDLDDSTVDPVDSPAGERIVSGLRVLGSTLIASSIIPPVGSTCDAGGSGFINAIDAFTGVSTGQPFFDINGDGKVDQDDMMTLADGTKVPAGSIDLGIGMPTRPTVIDKLLVVGGSTGEIGSVTINPQGIGARRVSWREILGG